MKPVVDRLSEEYEGSVEFRRYNVEQDEEGQRLWRQYQGQYLPTYVYLGSDGEEMERSIGEVSESQMRRILDGLE